MQTHWRLAKNATANLVRGGAAALVALVLPAVLVRHMGATEYSVWVLMLQVVAYVSYLGFGLQTAVGRYVAYAKEQQDVELCNGIFSTALAGLSIAAGMGILLIVAAATAVHHLFPSVPPSLIGPMRAAMIIVGVSAVAGLPASAWSGVFIGLQRNEIPAAAFGISKFVAALGLAAAAIERRSILWMAAIMSTADLLSYLCQYWLARRIAPEIRGDYRLIRKPIVRELSSYCMSLVVWSFAMLLITGLDLALVGRFEFSAVTPYATSAALVAFLAGIQNAIFSPIMPHAAALHARQDHEGLGKLLLTCTRVSTILLTLTALPILLFAGTFLRIWIGPQYAASGKHILFILVLGNALRCTAIPYATLLVATAQHKLVVLTPLVEGVSNLGLSIFLGLRFGAVGVACGTFCGVIVVVLANFIYNMPRTGLVIRLSRARFLLQGVLIPAGPAFSMVLLFFIPESLRAVWLAASAFGLTVVFDALLFRPRQLLQELKG